jgi:dephospho-CoA kinase
MQGEGKIKIIGIAGLPRSGKDILALEFLKYNYYGVSLGDIVRDRSRIRHADDPNPISLANTTETSNWSRETGGTDFALKEALSRFNQASKEKAYKGLVIWSIRAPIEADFILKNHGQLLWVESEDKVRYKRYIDNLRDGEPRFTIDQLKQTEALQWKPQPDIPKKIQMDISYVKSKATKAIINNGNDLDAYLEQAKELISSL